MIDVEGMGGGERTERDLRARNVLIEYVRVDTADVSKSIPLRSYSFALVLRIIKTQL